MSGCPDKPDPPSVPPSVARVRVGMLQGIPKLVAELGAEPARLFDQARVPLSAFEDPENKVSFAAASRLLALCVQATHCDKFAFLLGQNLSPSHLGVPGFMLRAAPTVGVGLQLLAEHLDLHDEGGTVSVSSDDGTTTFSYRLYQPDNPAADQIYDLSMVMASHIMRAMCGPQWKPMAVRLSRHHCPDQDAYSRFFRCNLEFGAPFSAMLFSTRWLDQATPTADPVLLKFLEQEAETAPSSTTGTRQRLGEMLPTIMREGLLSATYIARQLDMNERTLHRRLSAEGTSFRQEVQQARYGIAQKLLSTTDMDVSEISQELGYSEVSVFSRAFKAWAGLTASEWRRRAHRNPLYE